MTAHDAAEPQRTPDRQTPEPQPTTPTTVPARDAADRRPARSGAAPGPTQFLSRGSTHATSWSSSWPTSRPGLVLGLGAGSDIATAEAGCPDAARPILQSMRRAAGRTRVSRETLTLTTLDGALDRGRAPARALGRFCQRATRARGRAAASVISTVTKSGHSKSGSSAPHTSSPEAVDDWVGLADAGGTLIYARGARVPRPRACGSPTVGSRRSSPPACTAGSWTGPIVLQAPNGRPVEIAGTIQSHTGPDGRSITTRSSVATAPTRSSPLRKCSGCAAPSSRRPTS